MAIRIGTRRGKLTLTSPGLGAGGSALRREEDGVGKRERMFPWFTVLGKGYPGRSYSYGPGSSRFHRLRRRYVRHPPTRTAR